MKYPEQVFDGKTYKLYTGERYYSRGTKRLHRVVWAHHHGEIPKGFHVHHKDGNTHNNDISNLELLLAYTHHSQHMTPERRAEKRAWVDKIRHLTVAWHSSPAGLAFHKQLGLKYGRKRTKV